MDRPGKKSAKKAAQQSYRPLKLGYEKKVLKRLVVSANHKNFPQQGNPLQYCKISMMANTSLSVALYVY